MGLKWTITKPGLRSGVFVIYFEQLRQEFGQIWKQEAFVFSFNSE